MDDLVDGQFDPEQTQLSAAQASIAATTCLTVLPRMLIDQAELHSRVRTLWINELTQGDLRCAEGQLTDVAQASTPRWRDVVQSYAGKTGAPYGRDAVLAASLAGVQGEGLRGWRSFGLLFGVLRQCANDRGARDPEHDTDLANATMTLLLAYALEYLPTEDADRLKAMHARCRAEPTARRAVWKTMRDADIVEGYNARLSVIGRRLNELLETLAPPSPHRDVIHWLIETSVESGRVPLLENPK
ncbi:hypothetical protein [Streptomyces sp. NPDC046909]|uniref:hypothetical protein n=1 Tax=Streptomyces sp. NPDC046909 TaxID=3155617 RepID=UPI0033CAECE3